MKKFLIVSLSSLTCLFVAVTVFAQVYPQALSIVDFKSAGTALHIFKQTGGPAFINQVRGGAALSGNTLGLCTNCAISNVDAGSVQSAKGVQIGTTTHKPTCAALYRGTFYTEELAGLDSGTKDITYQCLKAAAGTYSWVAVANGG